MDKNWLIRTKSNHILGPVSKEKVQELYKNGSIKPDDEICSGNGYWFFIREEDMVARFLLGNEVQGFNPISEAKDVITQTTGETAQAEKDDITMVGGFNLSALNSTPAHGGPTHEIPISDEQLTGSTQKETSSSEVKKKNNLKTKVKSSVSTKASKPLQKQNYLKYIGILGFLVLFLLVYFRKSIIRSFFQGEMTFVPISLMMSTAHAQEVLPDKKKSF